MQPPPSSQSFLAVFDRQFHLKELSEIVDRVLTTDRVSPKPRIVYRSRVYPTGKAPGTPNIDRYAIGFWNRLSRSDFVG